MKRKLWCLTSMAFVFILMAFCLVPNRVFSKDKVAVGSDAPSFSLEALDGKTYDLNNFLGKKVILFDFWSIYCVPCVQEIPRLQKLYEKYQDKGLVCFSINNDFFDSNRIQSFVSKKLDMVKYPILLDRKREVTSLYGVISIPVTVIISPNKTVAYYHTGFKSGDEAAIEKQIEKLLPSVPNITGKP